jgi:hypothetical protein
MKHDGVPAFVGTVNAATWELRLCPKSLSIFRLQIVDSTHSIFVNFVAQNHMFVGNFGAVGNARCLDTEGGMGGYPGLRCVKIYLLSCRCIMSGDGCCTTLTESIVEGPALSILPALRRAE